MVPTLVLACVTGVPLSDAVADRLVSTRTVVVHRGVHIECGVFTGDPLGSREAGTLKVLSRPQLSTLHKQPAMFRVGQTDGSGIGIEFLPVIRLDGKIDMQCDAQISTAHTVNLKTGSGQQPATAVDTVCSKTKVVLTPGQPVKVRISAKSVENQTWMELTATVVENPQQAFAAEAAKMTWTVTDAKLVSGIKLSPSPQMLKITPTYYPAPTPPAVVPASATMPVGPIFVHPELPAVPMLMPSVMPTAPRTLPQTAPPVPVSK